MYGLIKGNIAVERAYDICKREFGLDVKRFVRSLPVVQQSNMRLVLREFHTRGYSDNSLALLLLAPLLTDLRQDTLDTVVEKTLRWYRGGLVGTDAYEIFTEAFERNLGRGFPS